MPAKLRTSYEKVEDIPEGYGELFAERNGRFEIVGVEGIKTQADIDKLQEAARKERELHKTTKEQLALFTGFDPVALPAMVEELEEAKAKLATLTAEGKIDETKIKDQIDAAVNRAVGPVARDKEALSRQLEAQKKTTAEKEAMITKLEADKQAEKVQQAIRQAVLDAKVLPSAVEDAVLVGERMFEFVDGKLVTRADVGITPGLEPKAWAKDMQESRPHWWPASVGGGAQGGKGGSITLKDNPWSAEGWNITAQGKAVRELGAEKAAELAARVGSKLGAVRPTKAA